MYNQLTIFDFIEPDVGEFVESHGANICHIMRPAYIGKKVVYDCSTESRRWFRVGILEKYIPYEETFRSIIYIGKKQRVLLTHRPHVEIFECLPWESVPEAYGSNRENAMTAKQYLGRVHHEMKEYENLDAVQYPWRLGNVEAQNA